MLTYATGNDFCAAIVDATADLVIASVAFSKSADAGTTTTLELMRAEALDLLPEAAADEEAVGW